MRYQRCLRKRFISALLGVGLLANVFVIMSSPTVALAIPVAGDYVFTSGLTGTFTSVGTSLSVWDFAFPTDPIRFSNLSISTTNDADLFYQVVQVFLPGQEGQIASIELFFPTDPTVPINFRFLGVNAPPVEGVATFAAASVPEPTSLFLLVAGLGLLALVDYVRRQRRQAGMQVG